MWRLLFILHVRNDWGISLAAVSNSSMNDTIQNINLNHSPLPLLQVTHNNTNETVGTVVADSIFEVDNCEKRINFAINKC